MNTNYLLQAMPGIRRDGTLLDSPYYADGQWVRFQRGKPRKMGGYKSITQQLNGPLRHVFVDARAGVTSAHYFSQFGVQRQDIDSAGNGTSVFNRTPFGLVVDPRLGWSSALLFSSTGGAFTALLAASALDTDDIASDVAGFVYSGNVVGTDPLVPVADGGGPISVSGGVTVLQPFVFVYGSNGLIRNSKENDFSAATGWSGGNANSANPTGTKVVYGAPIRGGGNSPAGLFWSLDSLIRVSFNAGATTVWSYDTLSNPMSILSKRAVVEHDGMFFWPGVDRFMVYNGVVKELPNELNLNYFYDNLNFAARNKVWGTKIARWGEIWWFFPFGASTECDRAVIFNYRENTWYDARLERAAGAAAQAYPRPIWAGQEDAQATQRLDVGFRLQSSAQTLSGSAVLNFASTAGVVVGQRVTGPAAVPAGATVLSFVVNTSVTLSAALTATLAAGTVYSFSTSGIFAAGETITGGTSGAVGTLARSSPLDLNVIQVTGTFQNAEVVTGAVSGATATTLAAPVAQTLYASYQHESGYDKVLGQDITAIPSFFTSKEFGFAAGAPIGEADKFTDCMTRLTRLEPDYAQVGDLNMVVEGRSFANELPAVQSQHIIREGTLVVSPRESARFMRVKIESNTLGGFYQAGQVAVTLEPGDERSTMNTNATP